MGATRANSQSTHKPTASSAYQCHWCCDADARRAKGEVESQAARSQHHRRAYHQFFEAPAAASARSNLACVGPSANTSTEESAGDDKSVQKVECLQLSDLCARTESGRVCVDTSKRVPGWHGTRGHQSVASKCAGSFAAHTSIAKAITSLFVRISIILEAGSNATLIFQRSVVLGERTRNSQAHRSLIGPEPYNLSLGL